MKKHLETIFLTLRSALLATLTLAIIFGPTTSMAAINTANWDIGGTGQTASSITINAYSGVTLTKVAFLASDNSSLADGTVVPSGTDVKYMVYVRNPNAFQMNDISINDVMDLTLFTMVSTDIKWDASQSAVATEAQIFTAVDGSAAAYTFGAANGDEGSYVEAAGNGTLSIGTTGGDTQLNIPANSTWAIIFTATVL